jgi:hypothetical protein
MQFIFVNARAIPFNRNRLPAQRKLEDAHPNLRGKPQQRRLNRIALCTTPGQPELSSAFNLVQYDVRTPRQDAPASRSSREAHSLEA